MPDSMPDSIHERRRSEFVADPAAIGYAGMTDAEAAAAANALTQTRTRLIPSRELLKWVALQGRHTRLEIAAEAALPPDTDPGYADAVGLRSACRTALIMVELDDGRLDVEDPEIMGLLDTLVAAGVWTQADRDSLEALAQETTSRAAIRGLGEVLPGHVFKARS